MLTAISAIEASKILDCAWQGSDDNVQMAAACSASQQAQASPQASFIMICWPCLNRTLIAALILGHASPNDPNGHPHPLAWSLAAPDKDQRAVVEGRWQPADQAKAIGVLAGSVRQGLRQRTIGLT
jgi:hypothetical protein